MNLGKYPSIRSVLRSRGQTSSTPGTLARRLEFTCPFGRDDCLRSRICLADCGGDDCDPPPVSTAQPEDSPS